MKVFALVDCNNFYVSCERVFNPALKYRPVAVLSNNDGCVIARSNETKALGISMGTPYFKIKQFCAKHNVQIYSSNYTLYGDLSRRVMDILRSHVDNVEEYSIDEAFLRFDDFDRVDDLLEIGRVLRETVLQWVGIPVSVGFAHTKVLAKVANHIAKKQTQSNVFSLLDLENRKRILSSFTVGELWGVGSQWKKKLNAMGILTAWELQAAPEKLIRQHFSVLMERIILELRGIACDDLAIDQPKKEIVCSRAFGREVQALNDLKEAVSCYAARACEKLRRQKSCASAVKVFVTSNLFKSETYYSNAAICRFAEPTQDTRRVLKAAIAGLKKIYKQEISYKKVGVMLLDIVPIGQVQANLFSSELATQEKKSVSLMETMDLLNQQMGKGTLFLASQGFDRSWRMRRSLCSPCYTTRWDQLLRIN
jgi:DNA polymerase V